MTLANILPQLFSPRVKLVKGRTIVNELNKKVFVSYNDTKWIQAIEQARNKARYSHIVSFDDLQDMTSTGTAYLKPVGVFTNANCFSSCDMFSAVMRDSNASIIFGEDGCVIIA
jgi:hypothetical protein